MEKLVEWQWNAVVLTSGLLEMVCVICSAERMDDVKSIHHRDTMLQLMAFSSVVLGNKYQEHA